MAMIVAHEFRESSAKALIYWLCAVVLAAHIVVFLLIPLPDRTSGTLAYAQLFIIEGLILYYLISILVVKIYGEKNRR